MAADNDGTTDAGEAGEETCKPQQSIGHQHSRIRVLHVDDDPTLVEMQREQLKQHDQRIELEVAQSAVEGTERLAETDFDCIVSDYAMPGTNGIEFCKTVREEHPELPFLLYTGRPCERVATEILSAGVTDYVKKENGTAHLAILADRIVTAVESRRTQRARDRLCEAIEAIQDGVALLDGDGKFTHVNDAYADYVDTDSEALVGQQLERVFDGDSISGEELLREANDTGHSTTTLSVDGSANEHVLVQSAPDVVVCHIRPIEEDPTGSG